MAWLCVQRCADRSLHGGSSNQAPDFGRDIHVRGRSLLPRPVSQLLAQARDDRVDHVSSNVVFEAPHIVEKFYSRNRFTLRPAR